MIACGSRPLGHPGCNKISGVDLAFLGHPFIKDELPQSGTDTGHNSLIFSPTFHTTLLISDTAL